MSELKCRTCGTTWNGKQHPKCPNCLAEYWAAYPGMISDKHDPTKLPSAYPSFRSTLPLDLPERQNEYYQAIAHGGTALYSTKHQAYCYVNAVPSHLNAGSAVPKGNDVPTYALTAFVVADPFGDNPHIYAQDNAEILNYVSDGTFQMISSCSKENCDNLQVPGSDYCAKHLTPSQAE